MTKEEIKKAIEVLQAYVDGKQIQFMPCDRHRWIDLDNDPIWNFYSFRYRIKPEKKLRPYTQDEFLEATKRHGVFAYYLDKNGHCTEACFNVSYCDATAVRCSDNFYLYDEFLEKFIWADDRSPCGIVEED